MINGPKLSNIDRVNAPENFDVAYQAIVTYPGEPKMRVVFMALNYPGGPEIAMHLPGWKDSVTVITPNRFGDDLDESWIRAFYTD